MTKPVIIIGAYPLIESAPGLISIELGIGKDYPVQTLRNPKRRRLQNSPSRIRGRLEATQKPWRLMTSFDKRTGRKPNGFDKAQAARELEQNVNEHLAPQRKTA